MLPIRDIEAVHYESFGVIICKTCYEHRLYFKLKILYSMVITRTTAQALDTTTINYCTHCKSAISFSSKSVSMFSQNNSTTITLGDTAACIHTAVKPAANYANEMVLRHAHESLMNEAKTFLHLTYRPRGRPPAVNDWQRLARQAARRGFFEFPMQRPRARVEPLSIAPEPERFMYCEEQLSPASPAVEVEITVSEQAEVNYN